MRKISFLLICFLFFLTGCAIKQHQRAIYQPKPSTPTLGEQSELQQSKRDFDAGYYKKALKRLLPLACDGVAEAQYAIGYLYYYGYGVTQDTDVGYFWMKRSADQHYEPAIKALEMISHGDKPQKINRMDS